MILWVVPSTLKTVSENPLAWAGYWVVWACCNPATGIDAVFPSRQEQWCERLLRPYGLQSSVPPQTHRVRNCGCSLVLGLKRFLAELNWSNIGVSPKFLRWSKEINHINTQITCLVWQTSDWFRCWLCASNETLFQAACEATSSSLGSTRNHPRNSINNPGVGSPLAEFNNQLVWALGVYNIPEVVLTCSPVCWSGWRHRTVTVLNRSGKGRKVCFCIWNPRETSSTRLICHCPLDGRGVFLLQYPKYSLSSIQIQSFIHSPPFLPYLIPLH